MEIICFFEEEYAFLSNFYPVHIEVWSPPINDLTYKFGMPSVEHAYQASKAKDISGWEKVYQAKTAGQAKRVGRSLQLRPDWEQVKRQVMLDLLRKKFQHRELMDLLVNTGQAVLIEGNDWSDRYWGMVDGKGENWLGRLLMLVRTEEQMKR